tara:strand:- start:737 stop:1153 length:417 start_codon:yes stop_codon:yes gene_type:complete
MPVVMFQVPESVSSAEVSQTITRTACDLFAEVLEAPSNRIRAYLSTYPDTGICAGGNVLAAGGDPAPFYQFYVLADRSPELVSRLHAAFTGLLAESLQVDVSIIRGVCHRISPDDWAIAGKPASEIRKAEIEGRKAQS